MKMERVRFVLQKPYRKRIGKYCVWTSQCEGFVHHHFRVTHPDWKKLWYEVHFAKKGDRRDSIEKNSLHTRRFGNLETEEKKS